MLGVKKFFLKNLQYKNLKYRVEFPEERNAFVLDHKHGHCDVTCKPATLLTPIHYLSLDLRYLCGARAFAPLHGKITFLMCELEPYPAWCSCWRKSCLVKREYSLTFFFIKGLFSHHVTIK